MVQVGAGPSREKKKTGRRLGEKDKESMYSHKEKRT